MIEIDNTKDMNDYLRSSDTEPVKFPAAANILLNDGSFESAPVAALEELARNCRRSLHCD